MNKFQNNNDLIRMLVAVLISMGFFTIWGYIFPPKVQEISSKPAKKQGISEKISIPKNEKIKNIPSDYYYLENEKFKIALDKNSGKISIFELKDYKEKSNKNVELLDQNRFLSFGWLINNENLSINSKWKLSKSNDSIKAQYIDKNGDIFTINFKILDDYLFEVTQEIQNHSSDNMKFSNYARIYRKDDKFLYKNTYSYSGILYTNEENSISELDYKKLKKIENKEISLNNSGWFGFSDQYWLTALINPKTQKYDFLYNKENEAFQLNAISNEINMSDKNTKNDQKFLFYIGPKNLDILSKYSSKYKISHFDKAIDFGMFYFISKPLLILIKKLYDFVGNFGTAIILTTVIVRLAILPLAIKSHKSMSGMKKLTPKIKELQETYKNDQKTLQTLMIKLYKDNKINPFASFVPILMQIPVFFALYKVLSISIEMRDAGFIFWIKDLSDPDQTSFLNLFGLLSFEAPKFLRIGLLPIIMGGTMFLQQKLAPMPAISMDKSQQMVLKFMPVIFTFMFASFPSGLILYWSISNIFTICQQFLIDKFFKQDV